MLAGDFSYLAEPRDEAGVPPAGGRPGCRPGQERLPSP